MLSTKVSRSAHRVWTSPVTVSTSYLTSAGTARSSHQRRRSSSKASCPPDSNDKPEPAEKAVATTTDAAATIRNKRLGKHRRTSVDKLVRTKDTHSTYKALPSVPDIQHLHQKDYAVSSFFSMHRPLSVTHPLPQAVHPMTFSSIFDSNPSQDNWPASTQETRFEDVIRALSQSIDSLDSASNTAQNDVVHLDVVQEQSNGETRHLDNRGRVLSVEEIVAQAKPYQLPQPPKPMQDRRMATQSKSKKRANPAPKMYTIDITVTETTLPPSYNALTNLTTSEPWSSYRKRRRENIALGYRARQARQIQEPDKSAKLQQPPNTHPVVMHTLSVKRQRKLKMKKHKLNKLRKRTRNLRRRLEKK